MTGAPGVPSTSPSRGDDAGMPAATHRRDVAHRWPAVPGGEPSTARPGPAPRPRGRISWHAGFSLVVLVCAAYLAHRHWPVVVSGAARLAGADRGWLLVATAAAGATWASSALAQQGATTVPLPAGRLVAVQFAAASANHVLPSGLGASAVNLRFLTRCGLPVPQAATALAVKAGAGAVARSCLIAGLALACPGALRIPRAPSTAWTVAACAAAVVVTAVAVVLLAGPLRRAVRRVLLDVRAVHEVPARAAALWGGSLGSAALHSAVVVAVTQAIGLPLSPARVALAFLAASSAAVLLPTPGVLGSLDAALALALTLAGAPVGAAASTVLGYRLLTSWLPLVPGLVTLGVLVRRRIL